MQLLNLDAENIDTFRLMEKGKLVICLVIDVETFGLLWCNVLFRVGICSIVDEENKKSD
jgi:hypothetical protein